MACLYVAASAPIPHQLTQTNCSRNCSVGTKQNMHLPLQAAQIDFHNLCTKRVLCSWISDITISCKQTNGEIYMAANEKKGIVILSNNT